MQDRNYIKMYCYLRCNKKQFEMTYCVECDSLRAVPTEARMLQTVWFPCNYVQVK